MERSGQFFSKGSTMIDGNGETLAKIQSPVILRWGPVWALVFLVVVFVLSAAGFIIHSTGQILKTLSDATRDQARAVEKLSQVSEDMAIDQKRAADEQTRTAELQQKMLEALLRFEK